jgi:hypothetical protein
VSVAAKKWVRKHSRATGAAHAVLSELAWAADNDGHGARLSYRELAKATKLHRNTVLRALQSLEAGDMIRRHPPGTDGADHCEQCRRAGRRTVYDVVMPAQPVPVADGQMSLLAGAAAWHQEVPSKVPSENGAWHTSGAVDGTPGVPQEEYEDVSLSLNQVERVEERKEEPPSLEADFQPVAQAQARGRARGAACKPVTYRGRTVAKRTVQFAERLLDVFNEATGGKSGSRTGDGRASQPLKQIVGALVERPDESDEVWERGVRAMLADPPDWVEDRVMVGHVFGPRAAEHTLARGRGDASPPRFHRNGHGPTARELYEYAQGLEG